MARRSDRYAAKRAAVGQREDGWRSRSRAVRKRMFHRVSVQYVAPRCIQHRRLRPRTQSVMSADRSGREDYIWALILASRQLICDAYFPHRRLSRDAMFNIFCYENLASNRSGGGAELLNSPCGASDQAGPLRPLTWPAGSGHWRMPTAYSPPKTNPCCKKCDTIARWPLPLRKSFHRTADISAKIRFFIFFGAVNSIPPSPARTALTALRFGAVHEISFPHRHHRRGFPF